ncbi:MAG: extracellular solute-binding protein [Chloroflexota bacterium]
MKRNQFSRRDFLRATATGAGAALFAAGSGIAFAQDAAPTATPLPIPEGTAGTLSVIQKTEYFPVVQDLIHQQIVDFAAGKGVQLDLSTANPELFGDFTAKMLAAVQAGNPPDLGYHGLSIPQMYALDIVEDMSDVVAEVTAKYGDVVPVTAANNAKIDGKWWAVPFTSFTGAWFARKDLFDAKGIDVYSLDTWDKRRDAALAVSDPANKIWGWGFTVNKSGDANGLIEGVIQAYGGSFTDETGLKVIFNSPETLAAVAWLADIYTNPMYKPMLPPGVESWTDTGNNEAYLAGTVALTLNQPSIYAKARADGNPVYGTTAVLHGPKTLDGRLLEAGGSTWMTIFKGAKNADLARELIVTLLDPVSFTPLAQQSAGQVFPAYKNLWTQELIDSDPNFKVYQEIMFNPVEYLGRSQPAQPSALIDAIDAASINTQMMSNITTGAMTVEQAVADAHDKIVQIFEEGGVPQS